TRRRRSGSAGASRGRCRSRSRWRAPSIGSRPAWGSRSAAARTPTPTGSSRTPTPPPTARRRTAAGSWRSSTSGCAAARSPAGGWISVNLSPRQIAEPDLVTTVARALERSGLAPGSLSLEVTETALLQVTRSTVRNIAALKELGVRLVLDDFGTGYSSLAHL